MKERAEKEYIEGLRQGSQQDFGMLYNMYADHLYGFALKLSRSSVVAEEIVQDTFLTVWQKRELVDPTYSFKAFLFTVAKNRILNLFRSSIRQLEFEDFVVHANSINLSSNSTDEKISYDEFIEIVRVAKEVLPSRQLEIFELSKEHDLSNKEIAEHLNISEQTVKNQLSSALKTLRDKLSSSQFLFVLFL